MRFLKKGKGSNINTTYEEISGIKRIKSANVEGTILYNTDDATSTSNNVLENEVFYNSDGKAIGTIKNMGILNIVPSENPQNINAGYITGGSVKAVDICELSDYKNCYDIAINIADVHLKQLDNIKFNGSSYFIDTKVPLFNYNKWKIEFELTPTSFFTYNSFLGLENDANSYRLAVNAFKALVLQYNYTGSPTITLGLNERVNLTFNYNGSKISLYKNGIFSGSYNITGKNNANIFIAKAGGYNGQFLFHSLKMFADEKLIRNFIPVNIDDVNCLFDLVTLEYYYNNGSGIFVGGEEV